MKTRQEIIYDFMLSLSANPAVFQDWLEADFEIGSYGDHVSGLAEELTNKYLEA